MILSCFLPTFSCYVSAQKKGPPLCRQSPLHTCIQNLFMLGPRWHYQHVGRLMYDVYVVEFVLIQSCEKNVFIFLCQSWGKREHNGTCYNLTAVCRGKRKRGEKEGDLPGQTALRYSNLKYAHSHMYIGIIGQYLS